MLPPGSGPTMRSDEPALAMTVVEPLHTPPLSLLLGISAMLPLAFAALVAWLLPDPFGSLARDFGVL